MLSCLLLYQNECPFLFSVWCNFAPVYGRILSDGGAELRKSNRRTDNAGASLLPSRSMVRKRTVVKINRMKFHIPLRLKWSYLKPSNSIFPHLKAVS